MGARELVEEARARELLEKAARVLILTGAGVSAESGVPTFRGVAGLWKTHRAEDLATPQAFRRDPRLVWEWYAWRRGLVGRCEPNAGHRALARLQVSRPGVTLVTQNVDGLHQVALRDEHSGGVSHVSAPLEIHGSLFRDRCSDCTYRVEVGRQEPERDVGDPLPHCPRCSSVMRPDVVWFGEALDPVILERSLEAAAQAELCLVVGTSALVHPAASLPQSTLRTGGVIIEVNPEPTPLSAAATIVLRHASGEVLPRLIPSGDSRD